MEGTCVFVSLVAVPLWNGSAVRCVLCATCVFVPGILVNWRSARAAFRAVCAIHLVVAASG
jgi:hypothetical protein